MKTKHWKIAVAVTVALIMAGTGILLAASKPHTVIHVVTVKWKDGATPEQIQKIAAAKAKRAQKAAPKAPAKKPAALMPSGPTPRS